MRISKSKWIFGTLLFGSVSVGLAIQKTNPHIGKQEDGSYIVSSYQRIEAGSIPFDSRVIESALTSDGKLLAVVAESKIFLLDTVTKGVLSSIPMKGNGGYRGAIWNHDGSRLFVSAADGQINEYLLAENKLTQVRRLSIAPEGFKDNPRSGGLAITKDDSHLFAASMDRNCAVDIDLAAGKVVREFKVENLPFEVKLSEDEKSLVVSNWGGRIAREGDLTGESLNAMLVTDPRGVGSSGTVSLINLTDGTVKNIDTGLHPTSIAIRGSSAYVANTASDSITEIDLDTKSVKRTIPIKWGKMNLFGSMPNSLVIRDNTLYCCNGGDNAICELDITNGQTKGFRPAGYYPIQMQISPAGDFAYVLNTKGNGSTRKAARHNAHDFEGTVSIIPLGTPLSETTKLVAENDGWNRDRTALNPNLAVYQGAIKHVVYIIKENRTYDEVFGDIPGANGAPELCGLGERVTPNLHSIVKQFTLFDNGYVSGTNSADGHTWTTQALANDYLEHFYTGYRTYPDDGDDVLGISSAGMIWDAALKKGKSLRVYGEYCDDDLAKFVPEPKDWNEVWQDRLAKTNKIQAHVFTRVRGLKPYIHPNYVYWPLLQSDQQRADIFIDEYQKFSKSDTVPNLMIMSMPSDHTEGRSPKYPKPQSMVADNDLAVGRVVEAISHSPQWKDTCIFVIEDDAQAGPDHVDGHRTVFMAISPYVKRKFVDSNMYTTVSMIRSIELMLGLDPMNRFDALTPPLSNCFQNKPDLTPYNSMLNVVKLGDMNPSVASQTGKELYWTKRSLALDWSGIDRADPAVLNQVIWHSLHGVNKPYPGKIPTSSGGRGIDTD